MSTKIYNGIRIERKNLDDFLEWFDETCISSVVKHAKSVMKRQKNSAFKEWDKKKHEGLRKSFPNEKDRKLYWQLSVIFSWYYSKSKMSLPGWNMDCWCNIYPYKDWFYIIPCFPEGCKYKYPKYVEEYGYWNNTDPLETVSTADWRIRGREWDRLIDDNDKYRLSHIVVEAKSYWNTALKKVEKRITSKFKDGTMCPSVFLDVKAKEFLFLENENKE